MRLFAFISIQFGLLILTPLVSQANEVIKVKGKNLLIELSDTSLTANQELLANSPTSGKPTGVVKLLKVKDNKATGQILKGKVEVGASLTVRGQAQSSMSGAGSAKRLTLFGKPLGFGVIGGFNTNSMVVKLSTGTDNLTGSNMVFKGLLDWQISRRINLRGQLGYDGFSAAGSDLCIVQCSVEITYFSMDGILRFMFNPDGRFVTWAGAGVFNQIALSKSSTALNEAQIGFTQVINVSGGVDWRIGKTMYIPLALEYLILPQAPTVSGSTLGVRAGVAWSY